MPSGAAPAQTVATAVDLSASRRSRDFRTMTIVGHDGDADDERQQEEQAGEAAHEGQHPDAAVGGPEVLPKAITSAPATAEPTTDEAMMRTGSAAANGIAPSEMNEARAARRPCRSRARARRTAAARTAWRRAMAERRHHAGGHDRGHDLQLWRRVGRAAPAVARPAVAKA